MGAGGKKNLDWIDIDKKSTVKKGLDRRLTEENKLFILWMDRHYWSTVKICLLMIYTICQNSKIVNRLIDTVNVKQGR